MWPLLHARAQLPTPMSTFSDHAEAHAPQQVVTRFVLCTLYCTSPCTAQVSGASEFYDEDMPPEVVGMLEARGLSNKLQASGVKWLKFKVQVLAHFSNKLRGALLQEREKNARLEVGTASWARCVACVCAVLCMGGVCSRVGQLSWLVWCSCEAGSELTLPWVMVVVTVCPTCVARRWSWCGSRRWR